MRVLFSASFQRLVLLLVMTIALAKALAQLAGLFLPPIPPVSVCDGLRRAKPLFFHLSTWDQSVPSNAKPVASKEIKTMAGYKLLMTAVGRDGMAMVAKAGGKAKLIRQGETLEGYRLERVDVDRALFKKRGETFVLHLKKDSGMAGRAVLTPRKRESESIEKRYGDQIQKEGQTVYLPKELLGQMHDLKKIFKRISIMPLRKGKKLEGFLVTRVARGSVFEKIGLRTRDVIVAVDGKALKSENDAMAYFGKLSDLSALELTVIRNKKKKVLRYEVY